MTTQTEPQYHYLEPHPDSNYCSLFLKGRRIRAATVWKTIHGPDPCTPEEFAEAYQVPLEAVHEALDYVERNMPLIEQEREREAANLRAAASGGPEPQYRYLEPRPGSNYRTLFLKGRRIRAAVVWERVYGPDSYSPELVAEGYQVPLEAVHEALVYVERNMPLIKQEREHEAAILRTVAYGGPEPI